MKVLIVGGGGREHAIATSVAKSSKVGKNLLCTRKCGNRSDRRMRTDRSNGI